MIRLLSGVENQNHHTLDTAFAEDDRPWIEADAGRPRLPHGRNARRDPAR